jgi:hypothetical protein
VLYALPEILLLALCGTIVGADDFSEITLWGQEHLSLLRRFLPFRHGIPSHDTLTELVAARVRNCSSSASWPGRKHCAPASRPRSPDTGSRRSRC